VSPVFEQGHEWAGEMFLWPALLNTVMESWFPCRREIFEQFGDNQLLKRTCHHDVSYEDHKSGHCRSTCHIVKDKLCDTLGVESHIIAGGVIWFRQNAVAFSVCTASSLFGDACHCSFCSGGVILLPALPSPFRVDRSI
jgi:hypothetical protein